MTTKQKLTKVQWIEKNLQTLAGLQAAAKDIVREVDEVVAEALKAHPELKAHHGRLEAELAGMSDMIAAQILIVKNATLVLEETVKGDELQAVFSQGKTSWNTDKLLGYAATHKAVLEMKKQGDPSISIRKVGK